MKGYVARKGNRWYAVIYEGIDPITGKERRSWHPAGPSRADAERLAARVATSPDATTRCRGCARSVPSSRAGGSPCDLRVMSGLSAVQLVWSGPSSGPEQVVRRLRRPLGVVSLVECRRVG